MSFVRIAVAGCLIAAVSACHKKTEMEDHTAHMAPGDVALSPAAPSTSQGTPGLPPSANSAPARLKASNRHAEWVKIAWEPGSKDSLMAWIVYPSTNRTKSPVVVVVHEIYGLQTWVRGVADQVAAEGFIAIAPDLNSRTRGGPSTDELAADSASKLIRQVNAAERNRGVTAAATYAMSQPSADKRYGVIGFCWGGQTVWGYSVNGGVPGFGGGVAFYGAFPYSADGVPVADSMAKIKTPVVLLNGSKDARIAASMPTIESMMKGMGKNYMGKNYEGAVHGFARAQDDPKTSRDPAVPAVRDPAEEQANLAAIKDGWPITVSFLKKNLGLN